MQGIKNVIIFSVTISFLSCGGGGTESGNNNQNVVDNSESTEIASNKEATPISESEEVVVSADAKIIDGIYATSTALPLKTNHALNMIDNNPESVWKTLIGSGPEEGVMIYFNQPVYIGKVEISQPTGDQFAEVKEFEMYVNGQAYYKKINHTVNALFIKAKYIKADFMENTSYSIKDTKAEKYTLKSSYCIGISEIEFFDKQGNKIEFIIPKLIEAKVTASSTLSPVVAYAASNLFDCKKDFGWAESSDGKGVGESISIETKEDVKINKIKLWNGYQRSNKHYDANCRAKTIELVHNKQIINLNDSKTPQEITINNPEKRNNIQFNVTNVYSGNSYKDLVISEIRLYEGNIPLILLNDISEEQIKQNLNNENKILKNLLDKNNNISATLNERSGDEEYNYFNNTSITFRSNNSFVMYESEGETNSYYAEEDEVYSENGAQERIADGNWELIEATSDQVKLRVFGRIYKTLDSDEIYKGKEEIKNESLKIFQDVVTITSKEINGEKFINKIVLQ